MDPLAGIVGARRNEDIALDLMKFIAATTNLERPLPRGLGSTARWRTSLKITPPTCWSYTRAA